MNWMFTHNDSNLGYFWFWFLSVLNMWQTMTPQQFPLIFTKVLQLFNDFSWPYYNPRMQTWTEWKTMVHGTSMRLKQHILLVRKGHRQISWLFQNVQWFYKIPWRFQAWRIALVNWPVFHEREKPALSLGTHIYSATSNCTILFDSLVERDNELPFGMASTLTWCQSSRAPLECLISGPITGTDVSKEPYSQSQHVQPIEWQ